MKVLFVTRGFPSEKDVMAGNYEAVQAKALAAKGLDITVISVLERSWRFLFTDNELFHLTNGGVDFYQGKCIVFRKKGIRRLNSYLRKRAYKQVFKCVVKERGMPDIIHAHIVSLASFSMFLKDEYHLPFVITEHWTQTNVSDIPVWLKRMSSAYHRADRVICVSQTLAESLRRNFNVNGIVINNMVSDMFFKTSKVERDDHTFRFIACGAFRTNRNKGFDILVDAFAQARFPKNVTLTIVGDGPDRAFVEGKILDYGLSDQISLVGVKSPEELDDLLCHSDSFVLSSRLETFAIVVIEAMAKGLPVIATRSGGPETFLRPEHGILIEKENVKELSEAMNYMTEHNKKYDLEGIRQYCYDHFSQDVIAEQIISIYKQLLNKKQN